MNRKRILITSTDAMMYQFLLRHIVMLTEEGYTVDAAVLPAEGYEQQNYPERIRAALPEGSRLFVIHASRSPLSLQNRHGYRELKDILKNGYDLVWTNEPVMGVLTRLAARSCRRRGTKVLYVTHGFHFYTGAPLKNWLLFYPIEKVMAHCTDVLVTINRDDYALAQRVMHAGRVVYWHGIGFVRSAFAEKPVDRAAKRRELGIPDDAFVVLSVGELNENKNHRVVIAAMKDLPQTDICYLICGEGDQRASLTAAIESGGLQNRVHLLGFREDMPELYPVADCYVFPSLREGLSVSVMESMAAGLPAVVSAIRGNRDLITDRGGFLCDPQKPEEFAEAIGKLYAGRESAEQYGRFNAEAVKQFDFSTVKQEVLSLLSTLF